MKANGRTSKVKRFIGVWKNDYFFKTIVGSAVSFCFTVLFAVYHGYLGLSLSSVWHKSICVFYILLIGIRGSILLTEQRNRNRPERKRTLCRRKTFLISSVLLLLLNLSLFLPIAVMAVMAKPVNMGLIPAITMAVYTTYKITMASIHFLRQKRRSSGNILITELRTVNFIDALVSILTLQNTLIMVNQTRAGSNDMVLLSAVSSTIIYSAIVAVTVHMLKKGLKAKQL